MIANCIGEIDLPIYLETITDKIKLLNCALAFTVEVRALLMLHPYEQPRIRGTGVRSVQSCLLAHRYQSTAGAQTGGLEMRLRRRNASHERAGQRLPSAI